MAAMIQSDSPPSDRSPALIRQRRHSGRTANVSH